MVGDSSTVITPSLPTLSNASAMMLPILLSCAETVATLAILAGGLEQGLRHLGGCRVDPALERHRVGPGADRTQPLVDHRLRQHGRRRGAVPGDVVRLGRDLLGELSAQVLVRVLQLDLTGDGHAVVGDGGSAPLLVDDYVAALGAQRHLDGVREAVDTALQRPPRILVELQALGHEYLRLMFRNGLLLLHATAPGPPVGRPGAVLDALARPWVDPLATSR
jgi:hypothetical protein